MTADRTPQQTLDRLRPAVPWGAWRPNGEDRWDRAAAGHLMRRAAFSHEPGDLDRLVGLGHDAALDSLLNPDPAAVRAFEAEVGPLEEAAVASGEPAAVAGAWCHRMLHSPDQLRERLTLFWHGHFATSQAKVIDLPLMARQIALFREHALGRFGDLLAAVVVDPAMLLWLDGDANRAGSPNENLAREVFELFALGPGNYTEADIREAARALTGWSVTDATGRGGPAGRRVARFDPRRHDGGVKTVLGRTGRWGAGDVVRICLEKSATGRFIVQKLFMSFCSETAEPTDGQVEHLAAGFRLRNYDLRWLAGTLLGSWAFHSDVAVGQRVKSPVEFCVGVGRNLGGAVGGRAVADAAAGMGQRLLFPPDVSGWAGGTAWLGSGPLIDRSNFAADAAAAGGRFARLDPARLAEAAGVSEPAAVIRFFLDHLLQNPGHPAGEPLTAELRTLAAAAGPFETPRLTAAKLARRAAEAVLRLPDYQLA